MIGLVPDQQVRVVARSGSLSAAIAALAQHKRQHRGKHQHARHWADPSGTVDATTTQRNESRCFLPGFPHFIPWAVKSRLLTWRARSNDHLELQKGHMNRRHSFNKNLLTIPPFWQRRSVRWRLPRLGSQRSRRTRPLYRPDAAAFSGRAGEDVPSAGRISHRAGRLRARHRQADQHGLRRPRPAVGDGVGRVSVCGPGDRKGRDTDSAPRRFQRHGTGSRDHLRRRPEHPDRRPAACRRRARLQHPEHLPPDRHRRRRQGRRNARCSTASSATATRTA